MRHRVEQTRQTFKCSDKGLQSRRDQISRFFFFFSFCFVKDGWYTLGGGRDQPCPALWVSPPTLYLQVTLTHLIPYFCFKFKNELYLTFKE